MEIILLILGILLLGMAVFILIKLSKIQAANSPDETDGLKDSLHQEMRENRMETISTINSTLTSFNQVITEAQQNTAFLQDKKLDAIGKSMSEKQSALQESVVGMVTTLDRRMKDMTAQNEVNFENIRKTMENRLSVLQAENEKKLDEMRQTVDEKLQKTLQERIGESFKMVNDRLEQVYKGLGEMQTLASGVGDLKRVLSNVKTRGTLGEIQLGAILSEILAPEQYDTNVKTRPGSSNIVEFAIKLPGQSEGETVYLPVDSKFPMDAYQHLLDAYETSDPKEVETATKALLVSIQNSAKDIHDKYIEPPYTTEFGIMFLPIEGLYAEVVKHGMIEKLQSQYKVNIAGPTTMAALLNSLQMGFKTLAISKRSAEVWNILGAAKTEFDRFEQVLSRAQSKLDGINKDLDMLVGTRTRKIQKCLSSVHTLSFENAQSIIDSDGAEPLTESSEEV